ncbi:hypothetical protein [Sporichthya polymorpha]|uniref:8-oxoguanine DNA glycosylase OGG fold protein n=1 Tax=Sporichthya polymorpha TaxID=35751 RepID=UPI0003764748|nr:hypothetical protein [Sporichthya polymorpha]
MSSGRRARAAADRLRALPGEERPVALPAAKWRSALPDDAWPAGFPKNGQVWRQDVFDVALRWREDRASARQLLAAVLMWTDGEQASGRRRAGRALAGDPAGDRLEAALAGLRVERPGTAALRAAYLALRTTSRLPDLDADTCTRLLYFAGYRRGVGGVQPLMLDETIAGRLPKAAEISSAASRGSSLEWVRYIAWAAQQAADDAVEPDRVELDLTAGGLRYGEGRVTRTDEVRGRHARR